MPRIHSVFRHIHVDFIGPQIKAATERPDIVKSGGDKNVPSFEGSDAMVADATDRKVAWNSN